MAGGGGANVTVEMNVTNNSTSAKVEARQSTGSRGQPRIDIIIRDMVRDVLKGDLSSGQGVATDLERHYGLDRTKGMG